MRVVIVVFAARLDLVIFGAFVCIHDLSRRQRSHSRRVALISSSTLIPTLIPIPIPISDIGSSICAQAAQCIRALRTLEPCPCPESGLDAELCGILGLAASQHSRACTLADLNFRESGVRLAAGDVGVGRTAFSSGWRQKCRAPHLALARLPEFAIKKAARKDANTPIRPQVEIDTR